MLNNMGNFYLSCFEIANPIYTIIRFGLQEWGILLGGCLTVKN